MTLRQFREDIDGIARRYQYDDGITFVADVGAPDDAVTIDVVGDTAIVVVESDGDSRQHELDLPHGDAKAFMHNGVLTIEVGE
jgi:hypothetical protein